MKKISLVFILVFWCGTLSAKIELFCKARYIYQVYHEPVPIAYFEGEAIGRIPIYGTGSEGYYESKWSNTYNLSVTFYSGYELNQYSRKENFKPNSIVGIVSWNNGGYSIIIIEGWSTELKIMTEDEIKFDTRGNSIHKIKGYDLEGRYWEFEY